MNVEGALLFVSRFVSGEYDPNEYAAFLQWLETASIDELEKVADTHEALFDLWNLPASGPSPEWIVELEQKLDRSSLVEEAPVKRLHTRVSMRRVWVAAASVLVLISAGALWWYNREESKKTEAYNKPVDVLYKTVSTSRGQREHVVLPDGSKVELNAASSLKYPVAFTNCSERAVELSGEAFFEVAKDATLPFRVKSKGVEIEVLGTRFNVMAYEDEPFSMTTLVEGAVKVSNGAGVITLQPGQQAEIDSSASGSIRLHKDVNTEAVLAWRNGVLEFENADLRSVMRAIARRYNVEIQYKGNVPDRRFSGSFSEKNDIDQILTILEYQHIHCKLNGKTIIVVP